MDMFLSLSADQRAEIEQGRPLIALVGSSHLKCVVVRADLAERLRYLSDATPDAGIQEAAGLLAVLAPEDWKRPEEWRASRGKWRTQKLMALIVVWAVVATYLAVGLWSSSRQTQIAHDEQLKRTLIPSVESFQRWKADGMRLTIRAFNVWLPLAQQSVTPDGTTQFRWSVCGREDGCSQVIVDVDSSERVTAINVYNPEF